MDNSQYEQLDNCDQMSEKFSSNDEEHSELVLVRDDEYLVPKFLDEHVASVRLRTPNNYFNEGYDVQVSAFLEPKEYI